MALTLFRWPLVARLYDAAAAPLELRRVLRPGGRLVMFEHVRPSGLLGVAADARSAVTAPLWGEHFDRDAEAAVWIPRRPPPPDASARNVACRHPLGREVAGLDVPGSARPSP